MSMKLLQQLYERSDLQIPPNVRGVFAFLLFKAKDDGTAIYPSIGLIGAATGHQPRQARNIIHWLEREGYIYRINDGRGRGNMPLWHAALNQFGDITPKKPAVSQAQSAASDRRGQKPRRVALVKPPAAEEFLDTEDRSGEYHQAYEEYQAGHTPPRGLPALRLVPQPGAVVSVSEIAELTEADRIGMAAFHSSLAAQIATKQAELAEKQELVRFYTTKEQGGFKTAFAQNQARNWKRQAEADILQIQAELAELEELSQHQQIQQRREVL